ncbi:DUF5610 domain-containing protein [Alishewanella jeotgali]|uniref:DUF5610 domain-containing protein n=1 Tax=Alishewanella jeotgali KCTC 22429 TaxID=1129374 RepID=H3ZAU7_9ALTE|nr:DUF5610 domain-containing protein [Alishewanella jeotgali]EHR42061.1 hypothetical protein AJE_02251 [Alishewanella jeotgali KCTC 22429]
MSTIKPDVAVNANRPGGYKTELPGTANAKAQENYSQMLQKTNKQQQNMAILQANEKVALQSGNNSLSLLYKTALEGINKELEPIFGKNAAQKIYDSGIDTSPEATAGRIVGFATSLFAIYQQQRPSNDQEQQLNDFMDVIGKGIEQGFADAIKILEGLQVFNGEVKSGVDTTYDLVMQGLQSFREKMLESITKPE